MKKNIILLIILIMIVALSCDKDENVMTIIDLALDISYIDSNGQYLLDSNTPNSYNTDEIKIYHYKNGEKVLFYMSNLDYSKGYFVYKATDMEYYTIRITQPNEFDETETGSDYEAVTFLELRSTETDTIKCLIRKGNNSIVCRKVYYNSNLVWAWEDGVARNFTIEK